MSKSIYEEAIGQLLKIQGRLSTNYDKFLEVKQALEQAQKQEKLLNKIKEIIGRQDDDSYISSMLEESQKYYEIKKLINGS